MTNIKYLKENNLYEAHKHFMQLCETFGHVMQEEGEDDPNAQQDPNAMGGAPSGDPNAMGGMPGGGPMAGGDPNAMGGDPNAAPGGQEMGADSNAMGQPMPDASAPVGPDTGEDPFADQRTGDDEMEDEGGMPDDAIDIEGLTDTEKKIYVKQNHLGRDFSKVDSKITDLIDKIEGLQSALDSNNSELETLKAEFEKRNPTQTEKLDMRGVYDSYPFNVTPGDFWEKKMQDKPNYEIYTDNDKSTEDQYAITADDVNDLPSDIEKSFSIDDDDIQTLDKLFKL